MLSLKNFLHTKPVFLYLLPVFFVLHGYTENYNFVSVPDSLFLCLKFLILSFSFALVLFLIYKNFIKANLVAFVIMSYDLFFGNIHDFFKSIFGNSFIIKYSFVFCASVILFVLLLILLKKTRRPLAGITKYLNWLFLLLIFLDSVNLILKLQKKDKADAIILPKEFIVCDTCAKQDIYLIVADEYANTKQLKDAFDFDNTPFENELTKKGFHIIKNSKSNYNSTPFSIASMMMMNYIDSIGDKFDDQSVELAYKQINNNILLRLLHLQNYQIVNNSVFHFDNITNPVNSSFFIRGTDLITSQTLIGRFNRDIRFNLITRLRLKSEIKKFIQSRLHNNNTLIYNTIKTANSKSISPRFIYLHTMMPHFPYLVDKNGIPDYSVSFLESNRFNKDGYIGYLQYSNNIFLNLIDKIQIASPSSIIIFMGDHGFRHLEGNTNGHFMSFNSIYLPGKKYADFYDGMSNVNEFRVLFNTQFGQNLPLLKDSAIFLKNWW